MANDIPECPECKRKSKNIYIKRKFEGKMIDRKLQDINYCEVCGMFFSKKFIMAMFDRDNNECDTESQ